MSVLSEYQQLQMLQSSDIFRFAFVRNPYSRLLSAYMSKIVPGLPMKAEILAAMNDVSKDNITDLSQDVTFADFVNVVCDQDTLEMNPHWNLKADQLLIDLIEYDFIGSFENLDHDMNHVSQTLFKDQATLSMSKNQTHSNTKLPSFYTTELSRKVYEKFFRDFEVFGYSEDISMQGRSDAVQSESAYAVAANG